MSLVDTITIRATAGKGGDGVVRWLHLKGKEKGGPSGGDGGKGGNVFFHAVRDLGILVRYKGRTDFRAEHGEAGGGKDMHGADGASLTIDVPVGAFITRLGTGETFELLNDDETLCALSGGRGGFGNAHFKSSVNQNPYEATLGQPGEADDFTIELKIIADAGLIGLPNAGKSSLLNALTSARAKIGDYPFTTLEPNLGVLYGHILADIPGLIEGAAEGKGLGHDFLRHIERTKVLIHCVAGDSGDPYRDYLTVRTELELHQRALIEKPELIFITKIDTISASRYTEIESAFIHAGLSVQSVSVLDDALTKKASDSIIRFVQESV